LDDEELLMFAVVVAVQRELFGVSRDAAACFQEILLGWTGVISLKLPPFFVP